MKLKLTEPTTGCSKEYDIKTLGDMNGKIIMYCQEMAISECKIELTGVAEIKVMLQETQGLGALFG